MRSNVFEILMMFSLNNQSVLIHSSQYIFLNLEKKLSVQCGDFFSLFSSLASGETVALTKKCVKG